jgi:glycosyltransferase involved in cell wall biosynthesis
MGGIVVLFELFLQELDKKNIKYQVIDTNKKNYRNVALALLSIFFQILRHIMQSDKVMLHGTAGDYKFIAPFAVFVAKLFDKKAYLRKFAGSFVNVYEDSTFLGKKLIEYVLKNTEINFFETKYLVEYFKHFNHQTYWFPNVRKQNSIYKETFFQKKFIFLGHICTEKGVLELIEAANKLGSGYIVDLYGSMVEPFKEKINSSQATYKGVLRPEEVAKSLLQYDVLVLPSYREGYPGVIIEAFSVGIPVVASSLEGIKEIVDDGQNGILVPPKNVDALTKAMQSFDEQNYESFSKEALRGFEKFDSEKVTKKVLEMMDGNGYK